MAVDPIVSIEQGELQGRVATGANGNTFFSFQGIPYAKPPVGPLRFKAPQPPEPWTGTYNATSLGNISAQIDPQSNECTGDENCLFINVYTPKLDGEPLPVMVFIHGGGYKFGSANTDLYGPDYLVEKDVVLVTFNYRCGILGFLSLNIPDAPGNAGMKDMVQALRWVKSNIKNFGGDANNITIFGESAGGSSSSFLTASPLSKPLINKAIMQSGIALNHFATQKNPLQNARNLTKLLGFESQDPEDMLKFLQNCSAKQLVDAHEILHPLDCLVTKLNVFTVVVEKEFPGVEAFITEPFFDILTSGRTADIPTMIGACTVEFAYDERFNNLQDLIPKELNIKRDSNEALEIAEKLKRVYIKGDYEDGMAKLVSDHILKRDIYRSVKYLVQVTNKPVYFYNFDYVGALNLYAKAFLFKEGLKYAGHMDELGYLFRNDYQEGLEISEKDKKVRERMVRMWTNFAKFGNPTPDKTHYLPITWHPANKDSIHYLNIGAELTLETDKDQEKINFWDNLYSKYFKIWEQPKSNAEDVVLNSMPKFTSEIIQEKKTEPILPSPAKTVTKEVSKENSAAKNGDSGTNSKEVIRANDPPEDDLPKNIGVSKFINFYDLLGKK